MAPHVEPHGGADAPKKGGKTMLTIHEGSGSYPARPRAGMAAMAILAVIAVWAAAPSPSAALTITPDYNSFTGVELLVLKDAVQEWRDLLPCSDGKVVPIQFVCDNSLGSLGLAQVWFKANGDVDHARVTLHNDGLVWNLADPSQWGQNGYDALTVAKHEVAHAIGFIHGGNFLNKVKVVGGDRFYDMNGDNVLNDNDFDLDDGTGWDGHAEDSTDLMYAYVSTNIRRLPTLHQAEVLADAYGYCVIPEPVTMAGLFLGIGGLVGYARKRRRA